MELKIENLEVTLQKNKILNRVSLTVKSGELISLLGASGCGKSTMLKSIAGLLDIEKGRICLDEKEIQNMAPEKRGTVIVFQDLRLFPHMTVEKNIAFPMELKKVPKARQKEIIKMCIRDRVLDYQGGTVTATLKGVRVDEIDIEKDVEAYLTGAGETDAAVGTTLDVVKTENGLQMTVTVPENTTDNTMAYAINVKYKGMLVYEGSNGNPAKKAIISVLAKGTDPAKQTLATMTITGNNKDNTGDFNKDITVKVSPQVGELKTVLRLYGTNLDSKIVKVRAIDENGIIFPVYDIPE